MRRLTLEIKKRYRNKNKDKIKKYRENNKEKIYAVNKEWKKNNKEKVKEIKKRYRDKNKNEISNKTKIYYKENYIKCILNNIKYRCKRKGIFFNLIEEDIIIPKNNICPYLNLKMKINENKLNYNSFTIDRINPLEGYTKNNILIVSYKANASKNNATIEEYELIVNNLQKIINKEYAFEGNSYIDYQIIRCKINKLKTKAKNKNIPFDITKEYLQSIYPKNSTCPLLKIPMLFNKDRPKFNSSSLDRIIPKLGYIKCNVIWISYKANTIKNNLTLDEMKILLNNWKNILNARQLKERH